MATKKRRLDEDRARQDRAVRAALARDDKLADWLLGDQENVVTRCRICREKGEFGFSTQGCCSGCLDQMAFGFDGDFWRSRNPIIREAIARWARFRVTRIFSRCDECCAKIPSPDGVREGLLCGKCYGIVRDESDLDRRSILRRTV